MDRFDPALVNLYDTQADRTDATRGLKVPRLSAPAPPAP
jgi:hypothetical protein